MFADINIRFMGAADQLLPIAVHRNRKLAEVLPFELITESDHPADIANVIVNLLHEIDSKIPLSPTKAVTVEQSTIVDLLTNIHKFLRFTDSTINLHGITGYDEDTLIEIIEEAQSITLEKYEKDQDERIVLAAAILHLLESEPTPRSKERALAQARMVLRHFGEPPIIDEPVSAEYLEQLSLDIMPEPSGTETD